MGDNGAWTIVEEQIVGIYDLGLLTLPVLDVLCKPFAGSDIDSGGHVGHESKDGKDMLQICVELVKPKFKPNVPDDYKDWDDKIHRDWWDGFEACRKRWKWR